ncbi:potassium channel family protein [Haloarchaeobius sp. TZWSO28]|uniref:potassium channel family protein n=1 Tax=Haloarchaeobius sp. TZWSO28 TaxID=3446119 RepID=UPI003EB94219
MRRPPLPFAAVLRRPLLRRMLRPVAAFVGVVFLGVAGFGTLGGVGVVDALFWLLDPSSIELYFMEHDGPTQAVKLYAIVVLSALVVVGLWIGETFLSAAFGGQMRDELQQLQMERSIDALADHVIVCGYGTFGKTIAASLAEGEREVVVVESQDEQARLARDDGFLTVEGDARHEATLRDAGIERAESAIGAVDDSHVNVQIVITASDLAPSVDLVVRVGDRMDEPLARRAGADEVIIPEVLSGKQVGVLLAGPDAD